MKKLPYEKGKVNFINILKYSVLPFVHVSVPHIEVLNLPSRSKFRENFIWHENEAL